MTEAMPFRPTLSIVGAGRAGTVWARAAVAAGYEVVAVASRRRSSAVALAARCAAEAVPTPLAAVTCAQLTILAVPDTAITTVAATVATAGVALSGRAVVHCSGATPASALSALRLGGASVGVMHPMRALTDGSRLHGAHVGVEASDCLAGWCHSLITAVGARPFCLPRERRLYHAAAALAGNAPVALLARAVELIVGSGLDVATATQALGDLMTGAVLNAVAMGPSRALTGPIARGDTQIVAHHLAVLAAHPEADRLYRVLAAEAMSLLPQPPTALAALLATSGGAAA